jgi:hypothetical protein
MTSGELVWASDNSHLLYTVKDELDRPYKVLLHVIGANKLDEVVFEERDEVSSTSSTSSGGDCNSVSAAAAAVGAMAGAAAASSSAAAAAVPAAAMRAFTAGVASARACLHRLAHE